MTADDFLAPPRSAPEAIDEAALRLQLRASASESDPLDQRRGAASAVLRRALQAARARVRQDFEARRLGGPETAQRLSGVNDVIVRSAVDFAASALHPLAAPTAAERMAVVAVGGFGRGEMAPYSDIDLLFLTPYKQTSWGETVIETTLYMLWDLKLKVGHATRSVADCLRLGGSDVTIRTALLEKRLVHGDAALFDELARRLWDELFTRTGPEFVRAKLDERDARHERMGGSRYLLEPNVKESKGGLRDIQTLFWLAKYLYRADSLDELVDRGVFASDEAARCRAAGRVLWDVRCGLHYLAGRAQEKLSFDLQPELADLFGYRDAGGQRAVERFMKRYFIAAKQVGDLTRIFCAALEHQHKKSPPLLGGVMRLFSGVGGSAANPPAPFTLRDGRLDVEDKSIFQSEPLKMLEALDVGITMDVLLHPDALRAMSRSRRRVDDALRADPDAIAHFLSLLTESKDPVRVLRRLSEVDILGRLLPEFGRVTGLMQFNMYHHYTVDEHTILAIETFLKMRAGDLRDAHPIETTIAQALDNNRVMIVALLMHDIGKGLPVDHSIAGEEIAQRVCPQLGMTEAETEQVAWLVRWHLAMSDFAQKRDVADPNTVRAFADLVRSPSRLRLLYLLTACDIRAVGPGVWNGWKAQLLRQLYRETMAVLTGEGGALSRDERADAAREELRARLSDWSDEEFAALDARVFPTYWIGVSTDTQAMHAEMMRSGAPEGVEMQFSPAPSRGATEVAFYTTDHPGIFARMTGALALARASVVDARAFTTKDGMALNTFWVQDEAGKAFDDQRTFEDMRKAVRRTLGGEVVAGEALASRRKLRPRERPFTVTPYVVIDNAASDVFTVIETNGRDRVGLLHDLSVALLRQNVNIFSAIIATYGAHAVDVFYVKDLFGMKLTQASKRARVEAALLDALNKDPG